MKKIFFPILILAFACGTQKTETENSAGADSLKVASAGTIPDADSVKSSELNFDESSIIQDYKIIRRDPAKNLSYSFDTIRQNNTKPSEVLVSFKFKSSSDPAAFDQLNKALAEGIKKQKKDFEDDLKERFPNGLTDESASTDSMGDEEMSAMGPQYEIELKSNYNNVYLSEELIVLTQDIYSYPGGMHPNTSQNSINYSVKEKKVLLFKDIFNPGIDYLNFVSRFCIDKLKDQVPDPGMLEEAASPTPGNFDNFYILKEGLFVFIPNVIIEGDHMVPGIVFIPYSAMKGKIRKELGFGY